MGLDNAGATMSDDGAGHEVATLEAVADTVYYVRISSNDSDDHAGGWFHLKVTASGGSSIAIPSAVSAGPVSSSAVS